MVTLLSNLHFHKLLGNFKGAASLFVDPGPEKFSLNVLSSSFAIRVISLLYP